MSRFYGIVGYTSDEIQGTDIHVNVPVEKPYKGDLIKNSRRLENGIGVNDDIKLSNQISIVADPYAINHMHTIRYVKWRGGVWKVDLVDYEPPRLILTLGGVYNGETAN